MSKTGIIVVGSLNPNKECQDRVRVFGSGGGIARIKSNRLQRPAENTGNQKWQKNKSLKLVKYRFLVRKPDKFMVRGWYRQQSVHARTDMQLDTSSQRYILTDEISYCLDANYWKGTTFEQFLQRHRRQLVIELWTDAWCLERWCRDMKKIIVFTVWGGRAQQLLQGNIKMLSRYLSKLKNNKKIIVLGQIPSKFESTNRVYDPCGISPTISTYGGVIKRQRFW